MYAYLGGSVFELMWVKKVTVTKKKITLLIKVTVGFVYLIFTVIKYI